LSSSLNISYHISVGDLSLGVKRPEREANHSPPSSAEVKESLELYLHSLNTLSWRGAWLSTWTTLHLPLPLSNQWAWDGQKYKMHEMKEFIKMLTG